MGALASITATSRRLFGSPGEIDTGDWDGMAAGLRLLARLGFGPATIVDVGASDGRWSADAAATFPDASLVMFEPHPSHKAALNDFRHVHRDATIIRKAVGGSEGKTLFDAASPFAGVLQKEQTADSITVPVTTLDHELAELGAPFLVKLDTHGVEWEILAGAEQTLKRSVVWIIEAYNHRLEGRPDCPLFWELCGHMAERGFRPVNLAGVMSRAYDKTLWQMDIFFVRNDWTGFRHPYYN